MPLFMDIHRNHSDLDAEKAKAAHKADLDVQSKHGVEFVDYWYSSAEGVIYCLYNAPSKEAGAAVHAEAHGHTADEIIEVQRGE